MTKAGSLVEIILLTLVIALLGNHTGCQGAPVESSSESETWDYKVNDPSKWPALYKKWCAGRAQSPVKLAFSEATFDSDLPAYQLNEQSLTGFKYKAYNDGHKIAVTFNAAKTNVTVPGHPDSCWRPDSVHWHWGADESHGSEHWMEGRQFPLEGHIVMWNCQVYGSFIEALDGFGGLAVLGVLFETDTTGTVTGTSAGLATVLTAMASNPLLQQCADCKNASFPPPLVDLDAFSLGDLLPADRSQYYLYSGSLTTPDCRENVMWTVYRKAVALPAAALAAFRSLRFPDGTAMVGNYRPALPLNPADPFGARRLVVRSFASAVGGGPAPLPSAAAWRGANSAGAAAAAAIALALTSALVR